MRKNKQIVALILARGGSKGVPRKNVRLLNGKPLIAYTIEQALQSKYLDGVWVSSEDDEILNVAGALGANTIERPPEFATDDSKSIDAVKHFISRIYCDTLMLVNACCPLTKVEDIDRVIEIFLRTSCDSVVSLVEDFASHPSKICSLDGSGRIQPYGEFRTGERQKLGSIYKRNTAIYLARNDVLQGGSFFGKDTRGYVMPHERSLDINDEFDWKIAEYLTGRNANVQ